MSTFGTAWPGGEIFPLRFRNDSVLIALTRLRLENTPAAGLLGDQLRAFGAVMSK
jgi:hypothetical protein